MAMLKTELQKQIELVIEAGLVFFIEGKPGIGKSTIVKKVAEEFNLKLIDIRLSTMDPVDISGIPLKTEITLANGNKMERMAHVPSSLFPVEGEALPPVLDSKGNQVYWDKLDSKGNVVKDAKGKPEKEPAFYDGWLLFFDEISQCLPSMQGATYRILLDREVGEYKLHPNVVMGAAGNRVADNASANPMDTALRARVIVLEHDVNNTEWVRWARDNSIDPRIIAFLQWKPELLHAFDSRIKSGNNPLPRTWEFANELLMANNGIFDSLLYKTLRGTVGNGTVDLLIGFMGNFDKLPDINVIVNDPSKADMPKEPGIQYALSVVLSEAYAKDISKSKEFCEYIERMEPELTTVTMINVCHRNRKVMTDPHFNAWAVKNTDLINAEI